MNVYIESYGCTRRKLDVSKFHNYFSLNGHTIVRKPEKADVILITTCAFKWDEEEASMQAIENFSKYDAKIIVYGCLPAIAPTKYSNKYNYVTITPKNINDIDNHFEGIRHKFADIDDANLIDKKDNYSSLPTAIRKFTDDFELSVPFFLKSCRYVKHKFLNTPQTYYLFTSRGCLGNCSYCAVRFAVGRIQSKPVDEIVREFTRGIESGYRDFSVLGDDVGAYGQDRGSNICELIAALLAEVERQGTAGEQVNLLIEEINPRWITKYEKDLVPLFGSRNVKSLLCPIQSGSVRILELMNRKDDIDSLLDILNEVHELNPQLQINTQIIVGFPAETEKDFEISLEKLTQAPFSSVVLFPYDDKEVADSHEIEPKVPENVINERIKKAQVFLMQHGIKSALCCNE